MGKLSTSNSSLQEELLRLLGGSLRTIICCSQGTASTDLSPSSGGVSIKATRTLGRARSLKARAKTPGYPSNLIPPAQENL